MGRGAAKEAREEVLRTFTASLDRLEVAWTRCTAADLLSVLADAVVPPAVGVRLPFAKDLFEKGKLERAGVALAFEPTPGQIQQARTGVTAAFLGVADYGSVVIQHGQDVEAVSLFPERHVAVLRASDVVPDLPGALARLAEAIRAERSSFVLATGPSATADMGALVRGAHGPREVHVILLNDPDGSR